jgi:hypothetical protein
MYLGKVSKRTQSITNGDFLYSEHSTEIRMKRYGQRLVLIRISVCGLHLQDMEVILTVELQRGFLPISHMDCSLPIT